MWRTTVSNKTIPSYSLASTIDPVNDLLLEYQNSSTSYMSINRNVFLGLASQPLGLTDTQSPTNKIFNNTNSYTILDGSLTLQNTGSVTRQAVFSLSSITPGNTRTITIPDASGTLALLSASNTFSGTNSFTGSSWTGGTISNASISSDTITGFTTANAGNIYGVAITGGQITGANTITNAALATGIQSSKLANPYKFSAYRSSTWTTSSGGATIVFNTESFDTSANYSTSTGLFTAPVAGFYQFNTSVGDGGSARALLALYKNGTEYIRLYDSNTVSAGPLDVGGAAFIQLATSDTIGINLLTASNVTGGFGTSPIVTVFSGYLVSAT
jgi:hypothetical protein